MSKAKKKKSKSGSPEGQKASKASEVGATPAPGATLTPKQELFIRHYLVHKNGTRAAIEAGYSEAAASEQAYENLRKPQIKAAIDRQLSARYRRLDLTADRILHELMLLATLDTAEAYDDKGVLKPIKEIPEDIRRAIAGVEVFEEFEFDGHGGKYKVGETVKVKWIDKKGALDTLAKNLKLLTDKLEVKDTTNRADRLAAIRARLGKK